jgi:DNA (cytosine-5)-methyltransferase 1
MTGQSSALFQTHLRPHLTAWDAIGHLSPDADEKLEVTGRWGALLPSIPEGENYLWHTDRKQGLPLFGWRTRYWSFLLKLAKNRPSWTLQAQPGPAIGPFHWKNRKLSWHERAALQTFPDSFRIRASRNEVQRQIGNAVPSLMAEILGREIAVQLGEPSRLESLRLAIQPADAIPPPEDCLPVPEEYHSLAGKHEPHPGTGRGRSYQRKTEQGDWQEPRCLLF